MGEIADALRRARQERESASAARESAETRRPHERESAPPETRRSLERPPASRLEPPATLGGAESRRAPAPEPPPTAPAEQNSEPAAIPREEAGFWQARAVLLEGQRAAADRFRHLAVRVQRELLARGERALLVTSPLRGEGKTVTSCNLALALASVTSGARVALVDLDLRRPAVARGFGLEVARGMEHVLAGECSLDDARVETDVESLDVYPVSAPVHAAHELLSREALLRVLEELRGRYRTIICDCPPVLVVPDVPLIAPQIGAGLLVTRAGESRRQPALEALRLLPADFMIGSFLNADRSKQSSRRYVDHYEAREDESEDVDA